MDTKLFIVLTYSTHYESSIHFLAEIWMLLIWAYYPRLGRRCWIWVYQKLISSAEFMINLFIQNFIPFLVLSSFPTKLRLIKGKGGLKPIRAMWGLPGYKSPFIPPVYVFFKKKKKKRGFSFLGLPWVQNTRLKQVLLREVRGKKVVKQEK